MKWLKSLFDPNRELVRFVHEGDSETARTLLAECKDALDRAVSGVVSEEVREVLTEDKEAKDKNGWTPLHYAAHMSNPGRVALLVQAGADKEAKDERGSTPLHLAAKWGQAGAAAVLVEAGADKEAKDKYGNTPLHSAANRFAGLTVLKGHALVIKVLVNAGASVVRQKFLNMIFGVNGPSQF